MAKEVIRVPSYAKYEKVRKKAGLTDYGVWKETKVPRTSMFEWKTGVRPIPMKHIETLAKYFKVDVNDLTKKG